MTYTTIVINITYVLYPIILDFMIPLNESRTRTIYYITTFSHDQIIYLDILNFNFIFTGIFGLLSVACSESITGICSYYICMLLKIVRWVKFSYWSHITKCIILYNIYNISLLHVNIIQLQLTRYDRIS